MSFETDLDKVLNQLRETMISRHKKYGPENIAKRGELGILVRMEDKFSRLDTGYEDNNDETIEQTLDDVAGYAVIWQMWRLGYWPGSPGYEDHIEKQKKDAEATEAADKVMNDFFPDLKDYANGHTYDRT